ncbi:MAG: MFS transporter [Oscillospiraceae bacterium]|nr:MFS transporter [Oscillospiraceae bacterium]
MASSIAATSGIKARDKIGYAMGDFGSLCVFGLVQSVLQRYYTDILQINIVSIMTMMVVARIWDAINDPIWGRIIDSAKPAADGRYRRWIKIFAVPVAVSAVLMFIKIPGLSDSQYLIYAYVTYILFGMLYTCINIPYGSLAQVVTSSDKERSSLSVFRSIGSTFGAMPAMALMAVYAVVNVGTKEEPHRVMQYDRTLTGVIVIAVLSVIAFFLCYAWNKERVESKPTPRQKGQTWKVIGTLFKSRPFIAVSLASMLYLAAQMFQTGYYSYLFDYYFNSGLFMVSQVCIYLPVAVIMFFATRAGNRFGRRDVCAYGILFASIINFILFFMHTHNVMIYLLFCLLTGIGTAFLFLLVWALAADAIDYNEIKFGLHDEATSYSFYSFMRKLGQTVAAVLINSVLLNIGYKDNVLDATHITSDVLDQMYNSSALIPAVLFLLVFVLLRFVYPLSKEKIDELQVEKEKLLSSKQ